MADTTSTQPMMLMLKSKDGEKFEVEKAVAMQINFVKGMLEGMECSPLFSFLGSDDFGSLVFLDFART